MIFSQESDKSLKAVYPSGAAANSAEREEKFTLIGIFNHHLNNVKSLVKLGEELIGTAVCCRHVRGCGALLDLFAIDEEGVGACCTGASAYVFRYCCKIFCGVFVCTFGNFEKYAVCFKRIFFTGLEIFHRPRRSNGYTCLKLNCQAVKSKVDRENVERYAALKLAGGYRKGNRDYLAGRESKFLFVVVYIKSLGRSEVNTATDILARGV